MNPRLAIFAAVLTTVGCGPEFQDSDLQENTQALKSSKKPAGTTQPSYAMKSTDAHVNGVEPIWKTGFPISTTYDVHFATVVSGTLTGHHTQTVFVFMPDGSPYQRFDVRFATDTQAGDGEQQAEKTSTGWRVWVSIPVAGTAIDTYGLTGKWSSNVHIDASATPNGSMTFDLH